MEPASAGQRDPLLFPDVLVAPTESVIGRRRRAEFQGGPIWPGFEARVHARHCRHTPARPFDVAPTPPASVEDTLDEAIWCGPVCPHFGHSIADFSMRIAEAAHRTTLPLLFSHWPGGIAHRPPWFDATLAQFGVPPGRVSLRDAPVRVARLHVFPQAERPAGPPPRRAYLDLLDRVTPGDTDPAFRGATVFVSRSRVHRLTLAGRIAGEGYLDEAMAAAGALVLHPETRPLAEQLRIYRSAARLVSSEGSALQPLQLMGRVRAEVSVLVRRPGTRMAEGAVSGRAATLHWLEPLRGVVTGHHRSGTGRDGSRAVTLLDGPALVAALGAATGLALAPHWDAARWERAWREDLRRWLQARQSRLRGTAHAEADAAVVARRLRELGLQA